MSARHMSASLLFAILLAPAAAMAAVEITPQVGYLSGAAEFDTGIFCLQSPCPSFAETENGPLYGAVLGVPLNDLYAVELLVSRQASDLFFRDGVDGPRNSLPVGELDVTHLHAGVQRLWRLARLQPFVAAGLGRTWIESPALSTDGIDLWRWSGSLGAGARVPLGDSDRYALRLEARGYWVDMPEERIEGNVLPLDDRLAQLETNIGLSFRF